MELDSMLTPEGPSGRRRCANTSDEELEERISSAPTNIGRSRRSQGSADDLRGARRKENWQKRRPNSEEDVGRGDVESQGSGSKRVQIVVDETKYYRRRSVDGNGRVCKCYRRDRDLSAGSQGSRTSRGSRGYAHHRSPDHLVVHQR